jgi:hypothetical protein
MSQRCLTNDANDIAASLTRLNFSVSKVIDGTFDDMRRALLQFGREAVEADMAVIYYSGHGMEVGGENWLIPIDAELLLDSDAENEAIPLKSAMLQAAHGSSLGLVILDACRNNPFAAKMQRSARYRAVDGGLVRVEPTDNVLVAYAAGEGTIASNGAGQHSPFTTAPLYNLETPRLEINFLFRNVRDEVLAATKREQQPFVYGSLSKQAIYVKEPPGKAQYAAPANQPVQTGGGASVGQHAVCVSILARAMSVVSRRRTRAEAKGRVQRMRQMPGDDCRSSGQPPQGLEEEDTLGAAAGVAATATWLFFNSSSRARKEQNKPGPCHTSYDMRWRLSIVRSWACADAAPTVQFPTE